MKTKLFAISLLVMMNSGFLYAKTCADQRDDLRKELDRCKTTSCKNQVKRQIDNFKCEDKKPPQPNTPPKPEPGKSCADKRNDLRKDLNQCKTPSCKDRVKDQIKNLDCDKPTGGTAGAGGNSNGTPPKPDPVKSCADKRNDLRKDLNQCKTTSCKNRVKNQIKNLDCDKPTGGTGGNTTPPSNPGTGSSCAEQRNDLRKDLNKCKTDSCKKRVKNEIKHLKCEPTSGGGTDQDSNCKEKKKKLVTRLKKCKTPKCKNSVRNQIKKVSCSEEEGGDTGGDGNISGNHSKECQHLLKLWTIKEPLDQEGRPDTTNKIDANFAYREVKGGLAEVVQGAKNNNYQPKKNSPLENEGKNHATNAAFRKGNADIGAFELGKPFPYVGASIPKWGLTPTNVPGAAKKAGLSFQPHRAHWVDQVRSEQDDL